MDTARRGSCIAKRYPWRPHRISSTCPVDDDAEVGTGVVKVRVVRQHAWSEAHLVDPWSWFVDDRVVFMTKEIGRCSDAHCADVAGPSGVDVEVIAVFDLMVEADDLRFPVVVAVVPCNLQVAELGDQLD
jgi:hypothetical protein